ncbi:MAG: beta-propeller fold lactonase family protein [Acidobacteriaceae bacterium]
MKLTKFGQVALATAACLAAGLSLTACNPSSTVDYVFVTSTTSSGGKVSSYHLDSVSGSLSEVGGSPFSSQGNNPVAEVPSPNGQYLYVANEASNNIAEMTIGTDGQLSPGKTYTTPGTEPISLAMNTNGTLLFVLDYYGPGYSDATPGPGALVVYPINSDGSLGSPVASGGSSYSPVQCFPGGVAVTANGSYAYVTNTNSVVVTTTPPSTGTLPATPAGCPTNGTISGFSVSSSGVLAAVAGSPFPAGTTPTGIAIDPTSRFVYAADSVQNQLIAYDILAGGVLQPLINGPFETGTYPVGITIDPRGEYLYVTDFNSASVNEFTINQQSGAPSAGASGSFSTKQPFPTCVVVDPALGRWLYTSDFSAPGNITAATLNPSTGALGGVQNSPFPANGVPTCVAAVPHGNHASQYDSAYPGQ